MSRARWTSAISARPPPVPGRVHWGLGLVGALAGITVGLYVTAEQALPVDGSDGEVVESVIVSLGAPARRLEPPPPPPPEAPPPEPAAEPQAPTERAEDAPPPAPPPQPRPVTPPAPSDGRLSSGFGEPGPPSPGPPPPPPPPRDLDRSFVQYSVNQYIGRVRYPRDALKRQLQGTGRLRVVISRSGEVQSWEIIESTGQRLLDREIERVAKSVEQLDPLPDYYERPRAILIVPFSFVMDIPE